MQVTLRERICGAAVPDLELPLGGKPSFETGLRRPAYRRAPVLVAAASLPAASSSAAEVLPRRANRVALRAFELTPPHTLDERELGRGRERTELAANACAGEPLTYRLMELAEGGGVLAPDP